MCRSSCFSYTIDIALQIEQDLVDVLCFKGAQVVVPRSSDGFSCFSYTIIIIIIIDIALQTELRVCYKKT